jgi:glycerophosphoryl diester phosphodiesterase
MNPEHEDLSPCLSRIYPPEHDYIEITIPSMEAAFALGATYVEFDIRRTADGQFAVFHDDMLDCKTEATGRVLDHSMEELRALDVGYGYYAEDGTYPLRGEGIGLMPSLDEVLDRFPTRKFLINVKNNRRDAESLARFLEGRDPEDIRRIWIFSDPNAADTLHEALPSLRAVSRRTAVRCLRDYMLLGWSGYVPEACRNTITGMFANYAWILWGWPHRIVERMERVGTIVILTHPYQTESIHDMPERADYAAMIPFGYRGVVETNRIDRIQGWMAIRN